MRRACSDAIKQSTENGLETDNCGVKFLIGTSGQSKQ